MQTEYKGYCDYGKTVLSCPSCKKALITVFDVGGENAESKKIRASCGICGARSEKYESVGDIKLSIGENGVSEVFDGIDLDFDEEEDGTSVVKVLLRS